MKFTPCEIPEIILIEPEVFNDSRGFFLESWNKKEFENAGIRAEFVQDNHSKSVKGTLRGLHYQVMHPQGKLVRVTQGEIFDVAVDLRKNSKYFGKYFGINLSAKNKKMLWIPKGFAHGFYVISDTAEFQYKCTDFYSPKHEQCIRWNDETIAITWPLGMSKPNLSIKDQQGIDFNAATFF